MKNVRRFTLILILLLCISPTIYNKPILTVKDNKDNNYEQENLTEEYINAQNSIYNFS